jgi:dephospho-CoA kinase
MPLKIGLTGGIGSGKSSAAALFAELGAEVIDTDVISHQLTKPDSLALSAICHEFGDALLLSDGNLDRAKLRNLIFADPAAKSRLENILHPLIKQEVMARLASSQATYIIVVVPLLLEAAGYRELVDRVLVVDCDEHTQMARVMARSQLNQAEVQAIMRNQLSAEERLTHADDVLDNNGDNENLRRQIVTLHEKYLALAAED